MKKMHFVPFVPAWIDGVDKETLKAIADHLEAEASPGHWIEENRRANSSKFICSKCGGVAYFVQRTRDPNWYKCCPYKYCPNCGHHMLIK